ncbi:MAG: type IV pilin protein [Pseudomonadota bacterium]
MADKRGFTLVELMMTVAIRAILGVIAYPLYTGYIASGVRAQATSGLEGLRMLEEEYFSLNNRYATGDTTYFANTGTIQAFLPQFNPAMGEYEFCLVVASNTYTACAIPQPGKQGRELRGPCGPW